MYFFKKIHLGFYVAFLNTNIKIWLVTEQNKKVLGHYFLPYSDLQPWAWSMKFQKKKC